MQKRQADEELQPTRGSKRRAVLPTTRMTRSAYKQLSASNDVVVELHQGLTMAPRQRKKPASKKTCIADTQQIDLPTKSNTKTETSNQTMRVPSAVHAPKATLDSQQVCAPIRIRSNTKPMKKEATPEAALQSMVSKACSKGAAWLAAANPGGPAPVAYMGGKVPLTISYESPPPAAGRHRDVSHSSLISPCSGPAQVCVPPTPSLLGPSRGSSSSESEGFEAPQMLSKDWTRFNSGWVAGFVAKDHAAEGGMDGELRKMSEVEPVPAVVEAMYAVESVEEATNLFANEMAAWQVEQCSELPVVEFAVAKSPVDVSHEEMHRSQMKASSKPKPISKVGEMDWTSRKEDMSLNRGYDGTTEHSEAPLPSLSSTKTSKRPSPVCLKPTSSPPFARNPVQTSCDLPMPKQSNQVSFPSPRMGCQKTAPSKANRVREKELRAQLIKMRKARARGTPQNMLVRKPDGSISITTVEQDQSVTWSSWPSHWQMDEDGYSVEEYDEDTVSY
ncbi:unnamed protein product [Discula destructiva]